MYYDPKLGPNTSYKTYDHKVLWLGSKVASYIEGIHNRLRQQLLQLVDKKVEMIAHEASAILDDENCHNSEKKKLYLSKYSLFCISLWISYLYLYCEKERMLFS